MIKIARPSVMSLRINMRSKHNVISSGTAFVVHSHTGPVLVTNWHNVTGRNPNSGEVLSCSGAVPDEIEVVHNKASMLGEWHSCFEPLYLENLRPRWREHPELGSKADCVALPLSQLADIDLYPFDLAECEPMISVGPAEVVSVGGFPFGLSSSGSMAIWATGFIATEPELPHDKLPLFLIDCRGRPGQSGSPVIAYRAGGPVPMTNGLMAMSTGP